MDKSSKKKSITNGDADGAKGANGANGDHEIIIPERVSGFLIVGIGASAGGIQALREFFQNVPEKSGIAYVVILHLSPDHDSKLAEVLQATTNIPVRQVKELTKVEPDNIYVVPPDQHLTMLDGSIDVSANILVEDRRAPVDIFFRTLAESSGPRAVAVILSGTGANGSMGIKRVKEKGGAAFVQNPREAEFNEMPRNSIATELIDDVLSVAQIPGRIIAYKENLGKVEIAEEPESRTLEQQQALREILTQLRIRTGHDFTNYKRPTLLRRIERRVNVRALTDLPAYAEMVREEPDEAQALLKDLLISVTNFFRDKEAFQYLETEVIPKLFAGKTAEDQVRIWCAGCATGEEAYSIAMMCSEFLTGVAGAPKVQIFATDIDEAAIATSREGLYTLNDAADVSPERLRRFFSKEGEQYRIRREIREMVLFASHNVIKDPPFSKLGLVTCRNLLIYLNTAAKERVMETFHFALEPGGYMFLGSSESTDGVSDLFANVSREHHVYQSRLTGKRPFPVPESVPAFKFEQPAVTSRGGERKHTDRVTFGDLHQQLLERYGPPSAVVNEDLDVVHLSENAGRFMQVTGGEPNKNVLNMVLPDLRLELRSALYQAAEHKINVEARSVPVRIGNETEIVNIHVRPVLRPDDPARGFMLILFEPAEADKETVEPTFSADEPIVRQLEEQLSRSRSNLRASVQQYEVQAEELKASNEELQAMNEELRSAAEELETSKEELQSINEELRTVNQELKVKVEETTIASNNLQNLINSTDIGTIFLDRGLRVRLFTPSTREIFNLIGADHGRLLSDITSRLEGTNITHDAETVLDSLQTIVRDVRTVDGSSYMMRILPYRTAEDRINGVVITFIDITEIKQAENELREQADELTRFNAAMVGREERMIELKKEVNDLCGALGEPSRYELISEQADDGE